MDSLNIAIVGAGPAGLTLARLLQLDGSSIKCSVFEGDVNRDAKNRGGSLDLHPDAGQQALKEAGLFDDFQKHARKDGETLRIFSPDGISLMDESRSEGGRPREFANRPEIDRNQLRKLLLDSLAPDTVHWNSKLLRIENGKDSKLSLVFEDHSEAGFDLVVGADGVWSKVRPSLSNTEPSYAGIAGLDCRISEVDSKHPQLSTHVGKGMCLNLGSNKGLMCQRNGDGSIQVYAFARLPQELFADCDTKFDHPGARQEIVDALFSEYSALQQSLVLDSDSDTVGRQLYMLPVGYKWAHSPNITLIGDAAHVMTPFAGVGVNVAMKDALNLAHAICGTPREKLNNSLAEFEVEMWKRAQENAEATMMYQDLFFHERGGIAMVEHFAKKKEEEVKPKSDKDESNSVYWMESEVERKRLAGNHYIAKDATDGKLILAPVDFSQPLKILDSATADGTWLMDLRADLPALSEGTSHTFLGTDLNPAPFPTSPLADVSFQVQDYNKPWPESLAGTFDLVHQRLGLLGAGPNGQNVVHRLCELVKPGGWIQLIEANMNFPETVVNVDRTPAYCDMLRLMKGIAGHVGAPWHLGDELRGYLEAEGLLDIQEHEIILRMGKTHPNEKLARNGVVSCGMAVQGLSAFAKSIPPEKQVLSTERYETLKADLEKELTEKGAVFPLKAVWARKPTSPAPRGMS